MKRKRSNSDPTSDCPHKTVRSFSLPPPSPAASSSSSSSDLESLHVISSTLTAPPLPLTQELLTVFINSIMPSEAADKVRTVTYSDSGYDAALNNPGSYTTEELERKLKDKNKLKPKNWEALEEDMQKPRSSPGFSDKRAEQLGDILNTATNEATVTAGVIPVVIKLVELLTVDKDSTCVPNSRWNEECALPTYDPSVRISIPQPDFTVGYQSLIFGDNVLQAMGCLARPLPSCQSLSFPCFTLEAKGLETQEGSRRQNRHNAAVMLRNLRKLRLAAGMSEETAQMEFDGTARVLTVTLSKYLAEVECHWTQTNHRGDIEYISRRIDAWALGVAKHHKEATRNIRNAIDWCLEQNLAWIRQDLQALEEKIPFQGLQLPPSPRKKRRLEKDATSTDTFEA